MVATRELTELARRLIDHSVKTQGVQADQLTLHADRGSSMASKGVAMLLSDLGVTKSHSRPHTSNDNPFSEAQFKTLKYRPDFPDQFTSVEQARSFLQAFFRWYNEAHHHVGIALMTPASVHYGKAEGIASQRDEVLAKAFRDHPERFIQGLPRVQRPAATTYINQPADDQSAL